MAFCRTPGDAELKDVYQSLQMLCLKRICRDVARHALKYQTVEDKRSSGYVDFHLLFSDIILEQWDKGYPEINRSVVEVSMRNNNALQSALLNFLFNPAVMKIEFSKHLSYDRQNVLAVAANCKNLRSLRIVEKRLNTDFTLKLMQSAKKLEVLDLDACLGDSVPAMRTVVESMNLLKVLKLCKTQVKNEDMLALCGHFVSLAPLWCIATENCRALRNLKLEHLDLKSTGTGIGEPALSCLLTHIPTLKSISVDPPLCLARVIYVTNTCRETQKQPKLQCSLDTLDCTDNPKFLQSALEACSGLKHLHLTFQHFLVNDSAIGKIFEECNFENLESLHFRCIAIEQIFTDSFKNFWERKGPQITALHLFPPRNTTLRWFPPRDVSNIQNNPNSLRHILRCCPNLRTLELEHFHGGSETNVTAPTDFPDLGHLKCFIFCGYSEFAVSFAQQVILSARNMTEITLRFPYQFKIPLKYLSAKYLPHLKKMTVYGNNWMTLELQDFILSDERDIESNLRMPVHVTW